MDQAALDELAARLEASQLALIKIRESEQGSNNSGDIEKIDEMMAIGLQLGLYLALFMDDQTTDKRPLKDVREYCNIIDELEREISHAN